MYDDDVQTPLGLGASERYYKVAKFPTRNIKTPIVLVYGGSDSLVDITVMLKELPRHTVVKEIPHFEHLDFLWAREVEALVFPFVFEALAAYSGRDHMKAIDHYMDMGSKTYSEDDLSSPTNADVSDISPEVSGRGIRQDARYDAPTRKASTTRSIPSTPTNREETSPTFYSSNEQTSASVDGSSDVWPNSKPYSSTFGNSSKHTRKRNDSLVSAVISDSGRRLGSRGIRMGHSKATTGITDLSPPFKPVQKTLGSET